MPANTLTFALLSAVILSGCGMGERASQSRVNRNYASEPISCGYPNAKPVIVCNEVESDSLQVDISANPGSSRLHQDIEEFKGAMLCIYSERLVFSTGPGFTVVLASDFRKGNRPTFGDVGSREIFDAVLTGQLSEGVDLSSPRGKVRLEATEGNPTVNWNTKNYTEIDNRAGTIKFLYGENRRLLSLGGNEATDYRNHIAMTFKNCKRP